MIGYPMRKSKNPGDWERAARRGCSHDRTTLNRSASFLMIASLASLPIAASLSVRSFPDPIFSPRHNKTLPASWKGASGSGLASAANYVRCLKAFGPLQQVELDGLTFVQCAVAIFLNRREVDENVLARRPLDESISFCPVKPLYRTLLSHRKLLSPLVIEFARFFARLAPLGPLQRSRAVCIKSIAAACQKKKSSESFPTSPARWGRLETLKALHEFSSVGRRGTTRST